MTLVHLICYYLPNFCPHVQDGSRTMDHGQIYTARSPTRLHVEVTLRTKFASFRRRHQ